MRARERVDLVLLVERVVMGVVTALRVLVNRLGGVDVLVGENEARVLDGRLVGLPRKTVHVGDTPVVVRSVRARRVVVHDVSLEVGHGCGCEWVGGLGFENGKVGSNGSFTVSKVSFFSVNFGRFGGSRMVQERNRDGFVTAEWSKNVTVKVHHSRVMDVTKSKKFHLF